MPLVVGHVTSCEPIPGKSTLKQCRVDVGTGEDVVIVTNAPNVRTDTHTVVALVGTEIEIAGESTIIARTNVGGVYSSGMICDSPMCGWVGGGAGIAVQCPLSLAPGSSAPTSKPRLGGLEVTAAAEPEMSDKERKAKEKADRKALAASKKAARKDKKSSSVGEEGNAGEDEDESKNTEDT